MSSSYDRARSLNNLIGDVAFMADLPTPTTLTAITRANVIDRLNDGCAELHNIILSSGAGDAVFLKRGTITTTGADPSLYMLAADFLSLKHVEYKSTSTGNIIRLRQFNLDEHPQLASTYATYNRDPFMYRLEGKTIPDDTVGQNIEILPIPPSGLTISYWYIMVAPILVDGQTPQIPGFSGFETYITTFAARAVQIKFENYESADRLGAELERIKGNILQALKYRDNAEPPRTRLVREQPGNFRRRYSRRNF